MMDGPRNQDNDHVFCIFLSLWLSFSADSPWQALTRTEVSSFTRSKLIITQSPGWSKWRDEFLDSPYWKPVWRIVNPLRLVLEVKWPHKDMLSEDYKIPRSIFRGKTRVGCSQMWEWIVGKNYVLSPLSWDISSQLFPMYLQDEHRR